MPNNPPAGSDGGAASGTPGVLVDTDVKKVMDALGISAHHAAAELDATGGNPEKAIALYKSTHGGDGGGGDGSGTPGGGSPPGGPSSGGSGGGGMSAQDRARMVANNMATFANMVRAWGIPASPRIQALVSQAAKGEWNSARFVQALRGTKEYAQAFPGIQWRLGQTEASYLSAMRQFQAKAQDAGIKLSRDQFGYLQQKGVDSAEWGLRVQAMRTVEANKGNIAAFEDVLKARGFLKPNENLTGKELKDFFTGRGSEAYTKVWNEYAVTSGLEDIGFEVGRGGDIGRKDLLKLLKEPVAGIAPGATVQVDYAQLAATAAKALPASRLYGLGITKRDLVEMALGGKKAAAVAARVQQAVATAEATASEQRVNPQLSRQGMSGGPGAEKVQATE